MIFKYSNKLFNSLFFCKNSKYESLNKSTQELYNNLFIFDLIKFLHPNIQSYGSYASLWDLKTNEKVKHIFDKYMITSILKIQPLSEIIYGYVDMLYYMYNELYLPEENIEKVDEEIIKEKKKDILLELLNENKFNDVKGIFLKKYNKDLN